MHYLLEPASGAVYADEHEFAPKFAPYSLPFGVSGAHAYHLLFRGKGGIYFWQRHSGGESGELKRAGDDPFAGEISPLAGSVFISGAQTYFMQSREVWHRNKSGRHLGSRHTELFRLKTNEQWRKIGLVRNGVYGAVYANGDKIYYFDALGTRQLIDSSVYEIADAEVIEILTRPYDPRGKNLGSEDIRKMIKDGQLVPAQGELVFAAVTNYDGEERYYLWIFLGVAIFAAIAGKAYEYKSRAKAVENEVATKPRGKVKFRR